MDQQEARRVASEWARHISPGSWPWPDVEQSDDAVSRAMGAMSTHLAEMVPGPVEAWAVTWQDKTPRALLLAGGALFVGTVGLEQRDGAPWPNARPAIRRVPLNPLTAQVTVESTYRGSWGNQSRTSIWVFVLPGVPAIEVIGDVEEDEEQTSGQRFAVALAGRLGWQLQTSASLT